MVCLVNWLLRFSMLPSWRNKAEKIIDRPTTALFICVDDIDSGDGSRTTQVDRPPWIGFTLRYWTRIMFISFAVVGEFGRVASAQVGVNTALVRLSVERRVVRYFDTLNFTPYSITFKMYTHCLRKRRKKSALYLGRWKGASCFHYSCAKSWPM